MVDRKSPYSARGVRNDFRKGEIEAESLLLRVSKGICGCKESIEILPIV